MFTNYSCNNQTTEPADDPANLTQKVEGREGNTKYVTQIHGLLYACVENRTFGNVRQTKRENEKKNPYPESGENIQKWLNLLDVCEQKHNIPKTKPYTGKEHYRTVSTVEVFPITYFPSIFAFTTTEIIILRYIMYVAVRERSSAGVVRVFCVVRVLVIVRFVWSVGDEDDDDTCVNYFRVFV